MSRRQRQASGVGGLAGLVAGGSAVFITDNEAGSVALLTVGVLFSFFALAGLLPTRLKLGDNEIEWQQEVAEALEDVVEESPPSARAALVKSLAELSTSVPGVTGLSLSSFARELELVELLRQAVPPHLQWMTSPRLHPNGPLLPLDALLVDPQSGRTLGVELKAYSREIPAGVIRRFVEAVGAIREVARVDALLLVTTTPLTRAAVSAAEQLGLRVVVAQGDDAVTLVREAILAAFVEQ